MTGDGLRADVVAAAVAMRERGLTPGTSGNLSARVPDGMLITPSAVPYGRLRPEDLIVADLDGEVVEAGAGGGRPSSEWRLHAAVYRARSEAGAVLHAHAPFCTALACLGRGIPAFHYMVAVAGGDSIRCAPYSTFGTAGLAADAVAALDGRRACLLANHGMVAFGDDVAGALSLAEEVESLAAAYWRALQVGEPRLLSAAEMAEALERFADYRAGS